MASGPIISWEIEAASGPDSSEEKQKEQSIHQPRLCTKLTARRTAGQKRTSWPDLMNNFPAENV